MIMRLILLTAVLVFNSLAVHANQQPAALKYSVSFQDRAAHYIHVQLVIPAPTKDTVELMMATWTPGSYLIREYARHVDQIFATGAQATPLTISKTSKNRWQVRCVPGQDVTLTYRLYCREMSVRTNWVDHDMAVLTGAATFLTVADALSTAHEVRFELPSEWTATVTALPAKEGVPHTYRAQNFDELLDSPVLCGTPIVQNFSTGGVPHQLATIGDSRLWDTAKAAADVQRIVLQQQQFWGTVPYPEYKFLNVIAETGGGLEHDNSTLVMTSRWNFRNQEKYEDWLSLMSHEFFHTWNVRRLRPAGLSQYNYEAENLTRSLWIAEGVTSYYEDLMLVRAGLIDRPAYLKRLSANIKKLQSNPGRLVQSLAEASFDSWIKFYRPDENSSNTRVSYYVKGCVVAFLLDAHLREISNGQRSLDDVMRLLYQRHADEKGYTEAQFAAIASEVAGTDMQPWLAQHVETAEELDYQPALDWLGLQFPFEKTEKPDNSDGEKAAADADSGAQTNADARTDASATAIPTAWLGVQVSESGNSVTVTGLTHGAPAQKAGVNVGDELLGFDQYRVNSKSWQEQLTQLGVGSSIRLLVARRGELRTLQITPEVEPGQKWMLSIIPKPSDVIQTRLNQWLGSAPAK